MEGPGHLPSRPREYVDLVSDDEEEDDAGLADVNEQPPPGHFPELNDLVLLDNLAAHERAVWDALDLEAGGLPAPILGDWRDDFPGPEAERIILPVAGFPIVGGPQIFDQAEWLDFDPQPVNSVNNQARNQAGHKADKGKMDNDNDLIQNEISNQLNNELSDNESNFFRELNRQFYDGRMDNDNDDDNFVWKRVNQDHHNANNTIDRDPPPANEMDNKARCLEGVVNIFPDICLDYISQLYTALEGKKTVTALVELVLEREENGEPYPKLNQLKRKRQPVESDLEEEIKRKYTSNPAHSSDKYLTLTRGMLAEEFPSIPMTFIMRHFYNSHMVLYTAYQEIAEAQRLWDPNNPSYNKLKQPRKAKNYLPHIIDEKLADPATPEDQKRAYSELKDVRVGRTKWETKLAAKTQREAEEAAAKKKYEDDEAANLEQAKRENTMEECGCCYDDFPRNRMVHCNNESITHFFCKRCARLHAETQIGSAKYELQCMSTDVCNAGYSHAQRQIFLDDNLTTALDRIEAETVLRLAGIENLASCPFCSYAAEYPPIEQERLFHCQRETCAKTSCRLCQKESHIPKTCKENAKDIGLDVRREVEEAMTKAMVRLCNKCKGPFIKEDGCNKMNCPCGNIQCYVCSKNCQYNHFDDERRGGKAGNCPLFDDVNKRHEEETKRAEEEVVEKLRREHPEVAPEDLEIKVSDTVKADEARRRQKHRHIPAADRFLIHPAGAFAGGEIPGAFLPGGPAQFRLHAGNPNQGWDLFPGPYMGADQMNRAGQPDQGQQQPPPNLQAAVDMPDPHHRPIHLPRHRRDNPARNALMAAAHARMVANRKARINAAIEEAEADRGRRLALQRLGRGHAGREIRELARERIVGNEKMKDAVPAPAPAAPRRGEEGDAEVIYRPGDNVVARRRARDWVFEPGQLPPLDGADDDVPGAMDIPGHAERLAAALQASLPHPRRAFPLPRHPARPPRQPEGGDDMIAPLEDDVDDEGLMSDARLGQMQAGDAPQRAIDRAGRRFSRIFRGVGEAGEENDEGPRREGERGLDFLMRLRRVRSMGKKGKGEEKK